MKMLHLTGWLLFALLAAIVILLLALVGVVGLAFGMVGVGAATLASLIAKTVKNLAPALLALVILGGCGARAARVDRFEHWTRYYEARMGLQTHEIRIGPAPGDACEWIGMEIGIGRRGLELAGPVIVYDPDRSGCRPPEDLALHAACHARMAHPFLSAENREAMGIDAEAEAKTCEGWYGPKRAL